MLTNPALAKVVYLNCDVFSLGKIKRVDGKDDDDFINKLKKPNYFQTYRQFLWSYRFWTMFGTAYLKANSSNLQNENGQLYWLDPSRFVWDRTTLKKLDKLVLSKSTFNDIKKITVKYTYPTGASTTFSLGELIPFHDLKNEEGNWFVGSSRIDSLYKILYNVETSLDAKNINLDFSKKYLISGNYDPKKDLTGFNTMQDIEKESIENKVLGNGSVFPVKSQIEIKRFVDDLSKLKLDDSYAQDLLKTGSLFNVPSEILDALSEGNTYENQEKALSRHIEYSESPKGMEMLEGICKHYGVNSSDYKITWEDCSFMQSFEKDKAEVKLKKASAFSLLVRNGVKEEDALKYLEIEL